MIAGIEIENGSCDLTTPLYWWFVVYRLGFDVFYPHAKFDDSSLNRSRDIIGAPKFKIGHVTLTMPLLRVICHQYFGT